MKEERRKRLNFALAVGGTFVTATTLGGETASYFLEAVILEASRTKPSLIIVPGFFERWLWMSHILAAAIGAVTSLIFVAIIQFHPIERLKRHVKLVRTIVPEERPAARS